MALQNLYSSRIARSSWLNESRLLLIRAPAKCIHQPCGFYPQNISEILEYVLGVESEHANNPKVATSAWPGHIYVCPTSEATDIAQVALFSRD